MPHYSFEVNRWINVRGDENDLGAEALCCVSSPASQGFNHREVLGTLQALQQWLPILSFPCLACWYCPSLTCWVTQCRPAAAFYFIFWQMMQNLFILPMFGADGPSSKLGPVCFVLPWRNKEKDRGGLDSIAVQWKSRPELYCMLLPPHLLLVGIIAPGSTLSDQTSIRICLFPLKD